MPYRSCALVFLFLLPFCLICQDSEWKSQKLQIDSFRNHVIILLDRSGSMKGEESTRILENVVKNEVPKLLSEKGLVIDQKALLQSDDYLSIGFFGLGEFNNYDYTRFITLAVDDQADKPFGRTFSRISAQAALDHSWKQIYTHQKRFFSGDFTGLSFAGPIGFQFFKNSERRVHRTFVLLISDGQFNSIDDPNNEISHESIWIKRYKRHQTLFNRGHISEAYKEVRNQYNWSEVWSSQYGKYKLHLYEYVPNQRSLDVRSIVEFDMDVMLNRTPGGYEKKLTFKDADTSDIYLPQLVALQIVDPESKEIIHQDIHYFHEGQANTLLRDIPKEYYGTPLKMEMAYWVDLKDDVYACHQLHPFGDDEQGAKGLVKTIDLLFEEKAYVLGFIPLNNYLYKISGSLMGGVQRDNVLFWNACLISLLLIILVISTAIYISRKRVITDARSIAIKTLTGSQISD